jgi:hypothetical protein
LDSRQLKHFLDPIYKYSEIIANQRMEWTLKTSAAFSDKFSGQTIHLKCCLNPNLDARDVRKLTYPASPDRKHSSLEQVRISPIFEVFGILSKF